MPLESSSVTLVASTSRTVGTNTLSTSTSIPRPVSRSWIGSALAITEASGRDVGVIIRGGVAKGAPRPDRPRFRNVWEAWEAAKLDELLEDGQSRVEFVLRFTLGHPGLSTIIVGTASVDHLRDNVTRALQGPLPEDVYREAKQRLDAAGASPVERRP
jgi:aryl-alcohol dehydrogenase-like predicted oxidoreductase